MSELAIAIVVLVPLVLLAYTALHLLQLGMTAGELTDAARQRLAGIGMLLLFIVVLACLGVLGTGLYWFPRVLKFA
jgi:hypothetical protein